jgi:hypothetical protein
VKPITAAVTAGSILKTSDTRILNPQVANDCCTEFLITIQFHLITAAALGMKCLRLLKLEPWVRIPRDNAFKSHSRHGCLSEFVCSNRDHGFKSHSRHGWLSEFVCSNRDHGFESHSGHGCLSAFLLFVLSCVSNGLPTGLIPLPRSRTNSIYDALFENSCDVKEANGTNNKKMYKKIKKKEVLNSIAFCNTNTAVMQNSFMGVLCCAHSNAERSNSLFTLNHQNTGKQSQFKTHILHYTITQIHKYIEHGFVFPLNQYNLLADVGFEFLTVVNIKSSLFLNMTPFSPFRTFR